MGDAGQQIAIPDNFDSSLTIGGNIRFGCGLDSG